MELQTLNIKLSGRGFVSESLIHNINNLRIEAEHITFYELTSGDQSIGWLVLDPLDMIADYTQHTEQGMRGKSTRDRITNTLVLDSETRLMGIAPDELVELDTGQAQLVLDRLLKEHNIIHTDHAEIDLDEALVFVSTVAEYLLVQTDELSIRIVAKDGIYILKDDGVDSKLTIINEVDGVMHFGEKSNVQVGPDGIYINDEKFDPEKIVMNVTKTLGESLGKAFSNMKFDFDFN